MNGGRWMTKKAHEKWREKKRQKLKSRYEDVMGKKKGSRRA